jgi:hypothetical protein
MARRGGAEPATNLRDEIRDLAPDPPASANTFSDPLRAEPGAVEEKDSSPAPSRPDVSPPTPALPEGAGEDAFDPRSEITQLRAELELQRRGSDLLAREMQLRQAGAQAVATNAPPGQPQLDPTLQEGLDILQITEDDLVQVFQGGQQGAQIVSRALQAVYLLAVNAAERRLISYYQSDQGNRQQAQHIEQRAQQMHDTFWESYPDLQPHELIVQHYASQVAREQQQSPRFDWDSAQREVARRTMQHLQGTYGVSFPAPGTQPPMAAGGYAPQPGAMQRPTLQSRIRPVVGEMGGGAGRGAMNGNQRSTLTSEILDLGRR